MGQMKKDYRTPLCLHPEDSDNGRHVIITESVKRLRSTKGETR